MIHRHVTFFLIIICTALYSSQVKTREQSHNWKNVSNHDINLFFQQKDLEKRQDILENQKIAKELIIRGDLDKAEILLYRILNDDYDTSIITKRYLSLIYFIKENFKKSLELLNDKRFHSLTGFRETCFLRLMNLAFLNRKKKSDEDFLKCLSFTLRYSSNNHIWPKSILKLKSNNFNNSTASLSFYDDNNTLRVWLKVLLYLNKEYVIDNYLPKMPPKAYRSKRIREILGLAFYRLGKTNKALSFISDIHSPNAENIRGSIYLDQGKLALAFGHFNLALKRKKNSITALERAMPIAWTLERWNDGLNLVNLFIKNSDEKKKLALTTAFLIKLKKFEEAYRNLKILKVFYRGNFPLELNLMFSYVGTMLKEKRVVNDHSETLCKKFDGLNCWVRMQMDIWKNLSKTIERDDLISSDKDLNLETLKKKIDITPIDEISIIDQKDIEELDRADDDSFLEEDS